MRLPDGIGRAASSARDRADGPVPCAVPAPGTSAVRLRLTSCRPARSAAHSPAREAMIVPAAAPSGCSLGMDHWFPGALAAFKQAWWSRRGWRPWLVLDAGRADGRYRPGPGFFA